MIIQTSKKQRHLLEENAAIAFESMKKVLQGLKIPESKHLSQNEEKSYSELNNFIESEIKNIEVIKQHLKNNVEWDQLNVAFFGETNAGKSTVIESIRSYFGEPTNGQSIGDGSKDFTKQVSYENFEYKNKKIGLIDLPGIEGNEQGNLDDIDAILRKGITKAHVVFYLYGSKKPEPATVKKIKKYLDEQATVFSICNNRGKAGQYKRLLKKEGKAELKETKVNIQAQNVLKETLGDQYQGDLFMNALAAYLSVGKIDREAFKVDKLAFLEVFESVESLQSFSNLNVVISKTIEKAENVEGVIFEANRQKLNNVLSKVAFNLNKFQEENISHYLIDATNQEVDDFLREVKGDINSARIKCKNEVLNNVDSNFRVLERRINKIIETGKNDKSRLENLSRYFEKKIEREIKQSLVVSQKICISRIETRLEQLERYSSLQVRSRLFNANLVNSFDLNGLSELDISLGDVAGFGTSLLGFIGGPIWGIVSIAIWGVTKYFGEDDGKIKAKSKISNELRVKRNIIKKELNNNIVKQQFNKFESKILNRLNSMKTIPKEMEEWKKGIQKSENKIKELIIT